MGGLQWWHVLIVVLVFLILFGGKKLPDAARGLGRSLRILKAEVGEMSNDKEKKDGEVLVDPATPTVRPAVISPTPLPTNVAEPIPPAHPVAPTQITIDGRAADNSR